MNVFVKNDINQFMKLIFRFYLGNQIYVRNGLVRFSNPSFVSGPCPQ
jgi:hypothetical protein